MTHPEVPAPRSDATPASTTAADSAAPTMADRTRLVLALQAQALTHPDPLGRTWGC